MSAEQSKAFESSPFMVKARQQEQYVSQLTGERDKTRKQTDKDFNPCDDDFTAPKAYDYDKGVNYYTVLGVDEYAPLEEIKKAYKKLSLIYHPDKMAGLSKEEQEERAGVFIEIKNAYLVLGDQASDFDRWEMSHSCQPLQRTGHSAGLLVLRVIVFLQLHLQLFVAFKSRASEDVQKASRDSAARPTSGGLSEFRARVLRRLRQSPPRSLPRTAAAQQHELVPAPQVVEFLSEPPLRLPLRSTVLVTGGTAEDQKAFQAHVLEVGQLSVADAFKPGPVVELKSDNIEGLEGLSDEAYRIEVKDKRITLTSSTSHGLFNAMMTLRQLMSVSDGAVSIPKLRIEDAPMHEWRGLMLDVSRHFFTADEVKHLLRTMALFKMNRFHWHLSDDQGFRVPIAKYPKLTEVGAWRDGTQQGHSGWSNDHRHYGGFYTPDQIHDVVSYAESLHIMVVPETDLPGHAQAIVAAYPEFSNRDAINVAPRVMEQWGVSDFVLAPNDKTFSFVSDLVSEVSGLIKSDYYHVGGDEVSSRQWDISPSAHRYEEDNHFASPRQIAGTFTRKAIEAANRLGRSGIVWDEALSTGIPLPQRSVVMIWRDWDNVPSKLSVASQRGLSVVMCPHSRTYLDFAQGPTDPYESQQGVVDLKKVYELPLDGHGAKVLGGQGQLWSEYISRGLDDLDFKAWPRGAAIAEATWCDHRRPGFDDFKRRVKARASNFQELGIELRVS
ncbi:nahA [Symbiodinium sp. CCMP2592]|nr:nahA [Symbiodinium sp. CCMP2592]